MADALPRIGETVQTSTVDKGPVVWKVYDVVHYLSETSSYDHTAVFLKKQDA